jgi:hypothetical protein
MSRSSILEVSNQRTPFTHGKQDLGHCAGANGKKSNQMQISTRLQTRLQWCRSPLQGLVACAYAQLFGADYLDTYAPVVKHCSIPLVIAIIALKNLDMIQFDIKTAFLYGDLQEQIYMIQCLVDSVPVWRSPRTNLHDRA